MIYVNQTKDICFKTACIILLLASCIRTLVIPHIYYLLVDAALLLYLVCLDYTQFRHFDKKRKYIYYALLLCNLYLAIDIIFHHYFYSIISVFLNNAVLPSVLVFLLTISDSRFVPFYVKHVDKVAWLAILIYPIAWWNSAEIAILYLILRLICYPNRMFFRGGKIEKILEFISIYFIVYAGIKGDRFNLLFMIIIYTYLFARLIFRIADKKLWKIYAAVPFVFAILLYGYGISLFDAHTYNLSGNSENLADTRTFLYYDVIESMSYDDNIIFGGGLEGRIITNSFDDSVDITIDRRGARLALEANLPDLMRRGGIVYLFIYLLLIYSSSYRLLKSKNIYMRSASFFLVISLTGSLVSFHLRMDAITTLMMLTIAMSNSDRLICMNNKEFEQWVKMKK